jgi:hypothetical protein
MTTETNSFENVFQPPFWHDAIAYWVPIALRERVLAAYRTAGIPIRIRYRGPRVQSVGREMPRLDGTTYRRRYNQAMQDCLLADATHFSVYRRK